jgi:predicted DNA-binding transcriptional regulator YafY
MSRTERLFTLLQALRQHRFPVSGASLAAELGVSLRTLYRDIATLQAQGAHIEGEPGLGYVLRPGFMLPPLMFSAEEIEALVLGSQWVAKRTDTQLGRAAQNALAKISAVLPAEMRHCLDSSSLLVGSPSQAEADAVDLSIIRQAIRVGTSWASTTVTCRARSPSAPSGRWPWAISTMSACWPHGVKHGRISVISGQTA